jgi:hypothetical protein
MRNEVAARIAPHHGEREARCTRRVAVRHPRMAVLLELERPRPAVLDRVPEAVEAADPGVPAPGEHEPPHTAHPDQLVVEDVRCHADERQIGATLPEDLVTGGEGDQVGEALERDGAAVGDRSLDRLGERDDLGFAGALDHGVRREAHGGRTISARVRPVNQNVQNTHR